MDMQKIMRRDEIDKLRKQILLTQKSIGNVRKIPRKVAKLRKSRDVLVARLNKLLLNY